jgi:SAM-dependent methyltransferase
MLGLEIGGPSPIFARGGLLPLYPLARRIDNVNFAPNTIWQDSSGTGGSFVFHPGKPPGKQFVAEGADPQLVPSAQYDFVLSSHMIEHTANPLRALSEWRRVLRPGGMLILVVPHRDGTFDHRRPITTMAHLIEDFERDTREDDVTHASEALQLHDLSRDPGVTDVRAFRERIARNAEMRSLHHHVFDTRLAVAAVTHAGFDLLDVEPLRPYHIVVRAQKPLEGSLAGGLKEGGVQAILLRSPFASDRHAPV